MRALRQAGYIAVTNFNIAKSQEFGDAIDKMIRSARLTLVLWTYKSAMSEWVRKEARLAYELEKAGKPTLYLGVMLEPVSLDLAVDLRGLQMIDLSADGLTENGLALVLEAVRERIGRPRSLSADAAEKTSSRAMDEFQLYEYARSLDVASGYEHFLSIYPDGKFAADARRDLWAARAWYMHPFRRGSIGHSLMVLSIIVALAGVYWGASQQGGSGEISRHAYDAALAEREDALAARDSAIVERDEALLRTSTAEAEAKNSESRAGEASGRLSNLEATANSLRSLSVSYVKQLENLRAEITEKQKEIDNLSDNKSCDAGGARGYFFAGSCIRADTKELSFKDKPLMSIAGLSNFTKLEVLDLQGTQVSDLCPLTNLKKLRFINISSNPLSDLSPLSDMPNLLHLDIWNTKVYNLAPLVKNSSISWLRMRDGTIETGESDVAHAVKVHSK